MSVFISEFIKTAYAFLTPNHAEQLRTFRNEIKDNFPACPVLKVVNAPWKDRKLSSDGDASEPESDEDFQPAAKRTRKLSDSTPEKEEQSIYRDISTQDSSDPFTTPSKKDHIQNGLAVTMRKIMIET